MAFDGGTGTALDPYLVSTPAQLDDVRNYLTSFFLQTADIDLAGYTDWLPIGDSTNKFCGTYDGAGFRTTGMKADYLVNYSEHEGLFGNVENATLSNISVEGTLYGCQYCGLLVGKIESSILINCSSTGEIFTYNQNYTGYMGGLVGNAVNCNLTNCYSSANITESATDMTEWVLNTTGGLIGGLYSSGLGRCIVENCYATGNINCPDFGYILNFQYTGWLGGFIGDCCGDISINMCYSTGDVTGMQYLGGFIGNSYGDSGARPLIISNCYAIGNVSYVDVIDVPANKYTISCCGGFVGYNADCVMTNCYFSGTLQTIPPINAKLLYSNAFVGEADNSTISGCYYDANKTSMSEILASPKTTAEMKDMTTFTDWDFTDIWAISPDQNGGYPIFLWQLPAVVVFQNVAHYIKQNGHWVEVKDEETIHSADIVGFETAVVTLVDTALDTLLGASY